jgi:multiple sugar transport system permease protein
MSNRRRFTPVEITITSASFLCAVLWAFPLYWAVVTSLKTETDVVAPGLHLMPQHWTLSSYLFVIHNTPILIWYLNSIVTAVVITVVVIGISASCGYALSQLRFPGRGLLYAVIVASFMVPIQALIVTHFILMADFGFINTWAGVILPQLIVPVVTIVYKQFFDSIPKDYREAATLDGASHFSLLLRIDLPMNWGVTTALAIITFIGAWNNFLWPFLVATSDSSMTVTVGITQVHDAYGVQYARTLATAVMAALPVVVAYLLFQKRVTESVMLSAGVKG